MPKFQFVPTEEFVTELFRLPPNATKEDFEMLAQKYGHDIFEIEGFLTIGCQEDMKHHVTRHIEAGYVKTKIPY